MKNLKFRLIIFGAIIIVALFQIESPVKEVMAVSPSVNFYQREQSSLFSNEFDCEDKTKFVFKYGNKIWEYSAENFSKKSEQFDINFRINKYIKNNNKNEKISLINSLKNINIENKIILEYLFPNLINKIKNIQNNIEKPAFNAQLKVNKENNNINIISETIGIKINNELLFNEIIGKYQKDINVEINIPTIKIIPEITSEKLKKYCNLRSTFSTSFASSTQDRKHNIKQAVKKINGTILESGEKFSFNNCVGRRTIENGFRTAKIISNGSFVDGVGGGVCQVSSTLYNAVLLAGLKVEKSNKHSEKVHYVNSGFDAMVNYGSSDLVFVNNTNNKIYIYAVCKNNKIIISIFGADKKGYEYKLRSEVMDIIPYKAEEVIVDKKQEYADKVLWTDESFYLKKAREGCTIKSYRDVYCYNQLVRSELIRIDKYSPQHAIKVLGSKVRPNPPSNEENS